jgi:glutaredoxin
VDAQLDLTSISGVKKNMLPTGTWSPDTIHSQSSCGPARLRIFDERQQCYWPDGSRRPYRLILFRDHHAWCPFCQKAWILLEELQLNYAVVKITMHNYGEKEPWYRDLIHPKATFPSLIVCERRGGNRAGGSSIEIINDSANVLHRLIEIGRAESPLRDSLNLNDASMWNANHQKVRWFCEAGESRLG